MLQPVALLSPFEGFTSRFGARIAPDAGDMLRGSCMLDPGSYPGTRGIRGKETAGPSGIKPDTEITPSRGLFA